MITYEQARQNLIDQVRLIVNALAPAMVKLYTPDERVTLWKAFDQTARKWETKFAKGAASSLEHDRRSILALLTGAKSLAKQRKATVDWKKLLKDIEDYMAGAGSEHWRETFAPLIEGIVTDQGEKWAARLGTQFDVQNLYARDFFNDYMLEFAQPINDTTLTEIGQVMARAQAEGSSIPEIQDQLDAMFEREISGRLPDDPDFEWYTDRTPPYRTEMIARTECLPAETLVDSAVIRTVFRRWYDGPMIEVITSDGRKLIATPNHPMLTRRGWIAQGNIFVGDYLICNGGNKYLGAPGNQNIQTPPATLRQIFDSLSTIGIAERERGRNPDFHGDGREGNVDILSANGELNIGIFSPLYKPIVNNIFTPAAMIRSSFCASCGRLLSINQQACLCDSSQSSSGFAQTSSNNIPRNPERFCNFYRRLAEIISFCNNVWINIGFVICGFTAAFIKRISGVAQRSGNASLFDNIIDKVSFYPDGLCDFGGAKSRDIKLDRVISIKTFVFSGHVYNLSTVYGYYTTNAVYTGNTIRSSNAGTTEIFTEWGVQKKEWLSTQDDRTRGSKPKDEFDHVEANGQVVGIDEPFIVSGEELQYPGDPAGSAGNVISCRCTVIPVIPDEGLPEQAPTEEDILTLEESELLKNYPELGQIADQIYLDSTSPEARRNLSEMTDLPPELMRMLKDNGAEIRIGSGSVVKLDDMGFLSNQSPRGWPEGTTWDKVGGVFDPDKNIIGVGSHTLSGSASTVLHEIGHAVDKYAGNVSIINTDIEAFLIKYADVLPPYYRQPDLRANLEEIFAEAFAQALTKNIVLRPLPEEIVDYVGKLAGKR